MRARFDGARADDDDTAALGGGNDTAAAGGTTGGVAARGRNFAFCVTRRGLWMGAKEVVFSSCM